MHGQVQGDISVLNISQIYQLILRGYRDQVKVRCSQQLTSKIVCHYRNNTSMIQRSCHPKGRHESSPNLTSHKPTLYHIPFVKFYKPEVMKAQKMVRNSYNNDPQACYISIIFICNIILNFL